MLKHEEQKLDLTKYVSAEGSSSCRVASVMFGKKKQRTCHGFGVEVHFKRNCLQSRYGKSEDDAVTGNGSDADSDEAFSASVGLICSSESPEWLIDSGATRHMNDL